MQYFSRPGPPIASSFVAVQLVCVDFTATWCGPCQRIGPKFVEFAGVYTDCVFIKVDVDENEVGALPYSPLHAVYDDPDGISCLFLEQETSAACGIKAMPTFQFYKGGNKIQEMCGADEKKLKELIEANK